MAKENMGLDGYYPCTIIRKAAHIGGGRTKREKKVMTFLVFDHAHLFIVVLPGRALFFLVAYKARHPILLVLDGTFILRKDEKKGEKKWVKD